MSKAKKAVYAEKQRAATVSTLQPMPAAANAPMPSTAKKPKGRKQSRGK